MNEYFTITLKDTLTIFKMGPLDLEFRTETLSYIDVTNTDANVKYSDIEKMDVSLSVLYALGEVLAALPFPVICTEQAMQLAAINEQLPDTGTKFEGEL